MPHNWEYELFHSQSIPAFANKFVTRFLSYRCCCARVEKAEELQIYVIGNQIGKQVEISLAISNLPRFVRI